MAHHQSGRLLDDSDIFKKVLGNECGVLKDLLSDKKHDPHKLLRQLDTLVRNSSRSVKSYVSHEEIQTYLDCLVAAYFNCSESIRLSRAVEKLWQPYETLYGGWIMECFKKQLESIVREDVADRQALVRVAALIEQNTIVQSVFLDNLELYLDWASRKLGSLIEMLPGDLSKEDSLCLYSVVKICLQVFQTCSSKISSLCWLETVTVDNTTVSMATRKITGMLIHILKTKGYSIDCVLLCGTATALVLNTLPQPGQSAMALDNILHSILDDGLDNNFKWLSNLHVLRSSEESVDVSVLLSDVTLSGIGALSLIRGCVTCGSKQFLSYQFPDSGTSGQKHSLNNLHGYSETESAFIKLFRYTCILCKGDITVHYHAFQLLLLWFSRLTKLISTMESSIVNNFTSIYESSLRLVLLNMDSPVEDVPEAIVEIFGHLLGVWEQFRGQQLDLPQMVLKKILSTHWYVKGRYRLLSTMLKYVDSKKVVVDYPDSPGDLQQCLTTNHLTSAATSVYKAILQEILKKHVGEEQQTEVWKQFWLPWVVKGLLAQDSLLRHNTSLHWIPVTLKLLPTTSAILQDHLSVAMVTPDYGICRMRLLHAWVVVTRTMRTLLGTADLMDIHVREAAYCGDEDVRSEAIALMCSTLKKAECMSDTEVKLLMECLPHNIKIDSAPFRQHLGSNLKKLLVRLRDSCVTMLKDPMANEEALSRSISFVEWFHQLCIDNLLPGACYQRRKGSLDLLHVIYDSLIYCPDSRKRKGFTPEAAVKLVDFAKSCGYWEFFSCENTKTLIVCLLDGADEIQSSAADLLTRYYSCLPKDVSCHLLTDSLKLCSSPRSHESQSGAMMCKYLFQKYIVEEQYKLSFRYDEVSNGYVVMTTESKENCGQAFLKCLLDEINRCRALAKNNLVEASKKYPVHGLILALTKCLTEVDSIWQQQTTSLFPLTTQLVTCCTEVIDNMLEVMASVAGQEACPSFAEIGMALENLLSENQPDYTESTSLSPEYQYVLSCCWNNIKGLKKELETAVVDEPLVFEPLKFYCSINKESCSCLGEVTCCLLTQKEPVEFTVIQNICDTFIKVLTKCRHKGVIEGTRLAFIRFCSALFMGPEGRLQQIPATVLTQVLLGLKCSVMTSSVTRRSAGIPIIIQAILVSEKKLKKTVLLTKAVNELYEIASLPLDQDSGLTDLPQVHGLNILNSLFGDASLTASLMGHISRTVILVIEKFASPSWAIRNAATRLFSTLVNRLFGQRKGGDDISCNSITFQEFSSYYPELPPFIEVVLDEASQCDIGAIDQLDPRLFPVMTLLSCLKPMDNCDISVDRITKCIRDRLYKFVESPVYQLRHLVAPALVAMVNMADMAMVAKECMDERIYRGEKRLNLVHGSLLLVNRLLDYIHRSSDLCDLMVKLMGHCWLVEKPCVVAGLYAKIVNKLLLKYCKLSPEERITDLMLMTLYPYTVEKSENLPVGYPILCNEMVQLLYTVWERTERSCVPLAPVLLEGSNNDVRQTCLQCIKKQVDSGRLYLQGLLALQGILLLELKKETYIPNISLILELLVKLYQMCNQLTDSDSLCTWLTENKLLIQKHTSLSSAALTSTAVVVKCHCRSSDLQVIQPAIESLCSKIQEFSQDFNETKKTSAAAGLQVAGECVLDLAVDRQLPWLQKCAIDVTSACLTLIQDEDTDIRSMVADFVSNIKDVSTNINFTSIHSNMCYELFLEYVGRRFSWSPELWHFLIRQLYCDKNLATIIKEKTDLRYQQLFDQEDNSFFAERLYNSLCIHKILKAMLKSDTSVETQDVPFSVVVDDVSVTLEEDLESMVSVVETVDKDSVMNCMSDSTILASMCGLVLLSDIVTMATSRKQNCRKLLNAITQKCHLPKPVQTILEETQ